MHMTWARSSTAIELLKYFGLHAEWNKYYECLDILEEEEDNQEFVSYYPWGDNLKIHYYPKDKQKLRDVLTVIGSVKDR